MITLIRVIYSIIITIILTNIYIKTPNNKLILSLFLICSISLLLKNIFILLNKYKYFKLFNKVYIISFLIFWFGFLMFWCYTCIINKQYLELFFSIPFWGAGIYVIRKRLLEK